MERMRVVLWMSHLLLRANCALERTLARDLQLRNQFRIKICQKHKKHLNVLGSMNGMKVSLLKEPKHWIHNANLSVWDWAVHYCEICGSCFWAYVGLQPSPQQEKRLMEGGVCPSVSTGPLSHLSVEPARLESPPYVCKRYNRNRVRRASPNLKESFCETTNRWRTFL